VRLSEVDAPHIVERVRMSFESHWASEHFEATTPLSTVKSSRMRFVNTIAIARGVLDDLVWRTSTFSPTPISAGCSRPSRSSATRHDRHKNLVVAATGTAGRAVVAALDYRQLLEKPAGISRCCLWHIEKRFSTSRWRLSRRIARRCVLARSTVAGGSPKVATSSRWSSRYNGAQLERIAPDAFDVLVIDEFSTRPPKPTTASSIHLHAAGAPGADGDARGGWTSAT